MDVTSRQDLNRPNSDKPTPEKLSKSLSDDRSPMEIPLHFFPGVGADRAVLLQRLGIQRPIDLLFFFPRSYQSVAPLRTSKTLETDVRSSVVGKIEAIDFRCYEDGRSSLGTLIDTGDGYVRLVWYNQPFRKEKLARGMRLWPREYRSQPGSHGKCGIPISRCSMHRRAAGRKATPCLCADGRSSAASSAEDDGIGS